MTVLSNQRAGLVVMLTAGAAALVALRVFDPATSGMFPPCPLRFLTGWYCPGCGSLRALHQLLQGNFRNAITLNPLLVLSFPFLAYGMASYARFKALTVALEAGPWQSMTSACLGEPTSLMPKRSAS